MLTDVERCRYVCFLPLTQWKCYSTSKYAGNLLLRHMQYSLLPQENGLVQGLLYFIWQTTNQHFYSFFFFLSKGLTSMIHTLYQGSFLWHVIVHDSWFFFRDIKIDLDNREYCSRSQCFTSKKHLVFRCTFFFFFLPCLWHVKIPGTRIQTGTQL